MKRRLFWIITFISIMLLPLLCCSPSQNTQPPPINSSSSSPNTAANKSESVNANSDLLTEFSSDPSTGVLITGQMPIKWAGLRWQQNQKERVIELILAQDGEWDRIQDSDKTSLALLACYVRDAPPGGAVRVLADRRFELLDLFSQSVLKTEDGKPAIDFLFSSSKRISSSTGQSPPDAIVYIWGSDQLEPQALKEAKIIHFRTTPNIYAPNTYASDVELKGKGRIAFLLQSTHDSIDPLKGTPISNIIETPVDFEP